MAEALLKHPGRVVHELDHGRAGLVTTSMVVLTVVSLAGYGVTVGAFSGGIQLWAAPVKLVLGALLTVAVCFPSLAIFSCLAGAETRVSLVFGSLIAMVSIYSILLVGFGPVSWVFSQATTSVAVMGFIHVVFWMVGLYFGMRFLFHAFRAINGREARHLVFWAVIFIVVSLQMTTCLRPIIGTSDRLFTSEKKFFVVHWLESVDSGSGSRGPLPD